VRSRRAPFREGPRQALHPWPRRAPPRAGPRRATHPQPHQAASRGGLCQAPHPRTPSSSPSNTHIELAVEVLLMEKDFSPSPSAYQAWGCPPAPTSMPPHPRLSLCVCVCFFHPKNFCLIGV
jgi:hypothetical protein